MIKKFKDYLKKQGGENMWKGIAFSEATKEMLNDLADEINTLDKDNDTLRVEITCLWQEIEKLKKRTPMCEKHLAYCWECNDKNLTKSP
jgi:predicted  nucleic acid-binding Zn-ribbon protein